jgi:1-phosphofructokinase
MRGGGWRPRIVTVPSPANRDPPKIAVFGPDPLLSVTIEHRGADDDVHLHAAGQGVWVTRMAGELGALPILCCLAGGETGNVLSLLLEALPGARRIVTTVGSSGSYVVDRRDGSRKLLAVANRPAPNRHEVDDLVAATCAAALESAALVICNPFPAVGLPDDAYATVAGNGRAAGIPVVVDLSSPRLDHVLRSAPDLVKVNDWELAEYVCGPVDGLRAIGAMQALRAAGAQAVAVTRAEDTVLVLASDDEPYEIIPPRFTHGSREGCGDTMTGAVAAALAHGRTLREALVLGVAAGAGNFLRHGLGTGRRELVEELAEQVEVRPLTAVARTVA